MSQEKHHFINIQKPFDYDTMMQTTDNPELRYSFVEASYLGTSILGRAIPLFKIGHGNRKVLYVGAHHGMEWITAALLVRFFEELCHSIDTDRRIGTCDPKIFLEAHTIFIIPMLNPDGVEYQIHGVREENPLYERLLAMNGGSADFSHWQANARGVDLNHNYDAGFEEYKQKEIENGIHGGASTRYSGETPESEPETRALCDFIRYHHDLLGIMTLHTQGEEIFFGNAQNIPTRIKRIVKQLAALSTYRPMTAAGLGAYGGLTDWCMRKRNLPSFTIECGKGENPLPFSDFEEIYDIIRPMLQAFPLLL